MTKRFSGLMIVMVILFGIFGLTGCSNGKTFEIDGWTLFKYNGNTNTKRGTVNIISANSKSLVVDGVLTIPAKIGKYIIHGFGHYSHFGWSTPDTYFSIAENLEVERIVLAAELHTDSLFWGDDWQEIGIYNIGHVEFLSTTFETIGFGNGLGDRLIK